MVFYFTCEYKDPGGEPYIVYMGADKYENEGLIEWGQTRDVWFHVDGLSSAHVYLRLPLAAAQDAGTRCGDLLDRIPDPVVEEMCQLVGQFDRGLQARVGHGRLDALGEFAQGRDVHAGGRRWFSR